MSAESSHLSIPVEDPEVPKDISERLERARSRNESRKSKDGGKSSGETKAKIRKVPSTIKDKNTEYFEPKMMAIGPIHANSLFASELKDMWAAKYLEGWNVGEILNRIKELQLKEFFDEEIMSTMDVDDLAQMLLMDGCAVLQFIDSFVSDPSLEEDLDINEEEASIVQRDLFLLENQIPFRVLWEIINHRETEKQDKEKKENTEQEVVKPKQHADTIKNRVKNWIGDHGGSPENLPMEEKLKLFIRMSNVAPAPAQETILPQHDVLDSLKLDGNEKVDHLLGLLRQALVGDESSGSSTGCSKSCSSPTPWKLLVFIFWKLPIFLLRFLLFLAVLPVVIFIWLLYSLCTLIKDFQPPNIKNLLFYSFFLFILCIFSGKSAAKQSSPISRGPFCSVQDMKRAGIKLEPCHSGSLTDVRFSSGFLGVNGCLKLLPILVDDSTPYKLLNLIAYESNLGQYEVTSYLRFLSSLIDDAQDVKDLRAAHILSYRLRKDAEVAEFIRKYSTRLAPVDNLGSLSAELREYCRRRRQVWAALFRQKYLSNPWVFLGLIGAVTGLFLTAVSTYIDAFVK